MELANIKKDNITSLELLEQINFFRKEEGRKTELDHGDLLKVIRHEFDEEISEGKFSESTYKNSRGREYQMFNLTLNQAKQVLVRESKYVRKAVMVYIEKLENEVRNLSQFNVPKTYLEALKLAVEQQEMLEEQKPKVEHYDNVLMATGEFNTTQIAKEFGISARKLNIILDANNVLYKSRGQWLLKSHLQDKGYYRIETTLINGKSVHSSNWTEKGREFVHKLMNKLGYKKII